MRHKSTGSPVLFSWIAELLNSCYFTQCGISDLHPISFYMNFRKAAAASCTLPAFMSERWTPLPSANDSCCQVRSGLSPPGYRPCRAHKNRQSRRQFCLSDCRYVLVLPIPLLSRSQICTEVGFGSLCQVAVFSHVRDCFVDCGKQRCVVIALDERDCIFRCVIASCNDLQA
jgi:hypothetical protein